ncbi:unnamed protein product [Durusdinium trenchii]|uniref:Uncharacterized protein n=2 Tax=Durusdinium trenchii TaxID=1381693 RepID=A0ABP0RIX1_9DINO
MPKVINATVEELEAARNELKGLIAKLNKGKADKEEVQPPATRVQNNVDDLTEIVNKNAKVAEEAASNFRQEAKDYCDSKTSDVRSEVLSALAEEEDARSSGQSQLEAQIQQLDVDVRNAFADELTSLCVKIEEEFATLRQELTDLIERKAQEAADHTSRVQTELSAELAELRKEVADRDSESRALFADKLQKQKDAMEEAHCKMNATADQDRNNTNAAVAGIHEMLEEHRRAAASQTQSSKEEVSQALQDFQMESWKKFSEVDQRNDRHQDFLKMLDQVLARRVEWLLHEASSLLPSGEEPEQPSSPSLRYKSYFSPKFTAAGCRGLQLELRVLKGSRSPGPGGPGPDNCSLHLWCPTNTQLHVRFFAGEKWVTMEKAQNQDGPIGAKRMGLLQDHISLEDDTLRVGVEILEAIQEVGEEALVKAIQTEEQGFVPLDDVIQPYGSSELLFQRHINHRVLSQVRKEVDKMQCKMVKRVEWLLTEADQLERQFPHDHPICSPVFSAGGVDGMQFIFYPLGYRDSTEGFCSLFLYCPSGVNIKCNLNAGSQKRDASNNFKEAGAFGRCNFCRLDSAIDTDTNTALLWLEIEELIQESKKTMEDEKRKVKKPPALELESAAPGPAGSVKLVRIANTDYLTEVRRLPAMWTDQKLGDFVKKPEGYRNFKELVGRQRAPTHTGKLVDGGAASVGGATGRGAPSTMTTARQPDTVRSESMPVLRSDRGLAMDLTAPGPDALPLLCGPHGEFGSDQGYGSPLLWAGKSRKARSSTSFRQRF